MMWMRRWRGDSWYFFHLHWELWPHWWEAFGYSASLGPEESVSERKLFSFTLCVWLFATPWTVTHQAPRSLGFSRQEYWSGLPFPSLLGSLGSVCVCVTASTIPLHFSLGWIWRAETRKHLRSPETLTEKYIRAAVSFSFAFLLFIIFLNVISPFISLHHFILYESEITKGK